MKLFFNNYRLPKIIQEADQSRSDGQQNKDSGEVQPEIIGENQRAENSQDARGLEKQFEFARPVGLLDFGPRKK